VRSAVFIFQTEPRVSVASTGWFGPCVPAPSPVRAAAIPREARRAGIVRLRAHNDSGVRVPDLCARVFRSMILPPTRSRISAGITSRPAVGFEFEPFDFAVCFLVLMFLPVDTRGEFLRRLQALTKPGGALVIVDKVQMPAGYLGTAFSRLTLQQKLAVGAEPEAILRKELSLAGYQRPVDARVLPDSARVFFRVGEFVGWIIVAPEC
jgi:hypothetical protein